MNYDDRLSDKFEGHIQKGEISKMFLQGGCYHFALWILSERLSNSRAQRCKDEVNDSCHTFIVTPDEWFVDIDGVFTRSDFIASLEKRFMMDVRDQRFEELELLVLLSH